MGRQHALALAEAGADVAICDLLAGIFAAQMLALSDPELAGRIERFKKDMAAEVERKAETLKEYR